MRSLIAGSTIAGLVTLGSVAHAGVAWIGDFEQNNLDQWGYKLNEAHISVVQTPVSQGTHAARIELTNDAVWPNGLKRVELQHGPADGRTAEGKELFFAWSFYLPNALPAEPSAQIGYWESNTTYQQMMAFEVKGTDITFSTRKPTNKIAWDAKGFVTPATWHRIAMRILWSTDGATGKVDVWFDGAQVVTGATAQTRADDNPLFTQVGLLRGKVEFADAPVILLDDAVEGDTLADVRPELVRGTTADAGVDGGATSPGGGASTSPGPSTDGGSPSSGSKRVSNTAADEGGCNTTSSSGGAGAWLLGIGVLAVATRLRRASRRRRQRYSATQLR
jgi:hypothetical protein